MPDSQLRQRALSPNDSFIVQAPAGSGKTELLVQRFLVLLAHVNDPEEILALTFTRKAAAEMRQRILRALTAAASHPAPAEPHAYKTWQLATAALTQDQKQQWNLRQNPHRLHVQTIDAFCARLIRHMPLLSGLDSSMAIAEDAAEIYLLAAKRCLASLEDQQPWSKALAELMLHLDNQIPLLEQLLVSMLARRDQWLPYLISHAKPSNRTELKQRLEQGLQHIVLEALEQCQRAMPKDCMQEVIDLLEFAQSHKPSTLFLLPLWEQVAEGRMRGDFWSAVAHLLLTEKHTWRIQVDKRHGFPPEAKTEKKRFAELLQKLPGEESLRIALQQLRSLPPITYSEAQWKILEILFEVLPILVAELKLLFAEKNVVDFTEISLAALRALGDPDSPTDLALRLDYQLQHILVDEFQDTSSTQYRLLEQLTSAWQPNEGRSLFVVGDPMQSIYRFRQADVGLFLKAQQQGIGPIALESMQLQANFRATPTLIAWVNTQFQKLFPLQPDIALGAAPFHESIAMQPDLEGSKVNLHSCKDTHAMAESIIQIITQQLHMASEQSIAILVRSRAHLVDILSRLKTAEIKFHAVEMESLMQQPVVLDLMALTGALLHLGDRLAWLAILRAPWCGLNLADLHAIAGQNHELPLWQSLQNFAQIADLSSEGAERLAHIIPTLNATLAQQGRLKLRVWIENTWEQLNAPAYFTAAEKIIANAYFAILEELQSEYPKLDSTKLAEKLAQHHLSSTGAADCKLSVMTIHKAKGLEFDTVIVPHLQKRNRPDGAQLLLWLDRPRLHGHNDLILAPIKAKKAEFDPIYNYLREIERAKTRLEMTRLLYVAVTRARKSLHLFAETPEEGSSPSPDSFLSLLPEWER